MTRLTAPLFRLLAIGSGVLLVAAAPTPRAAPTLPGMHRDPWPSVYTPLPRSDVLIQGARLLDGAGRKFESVDILVHEGRVSALGSSLPVPAGIRTIDGRGRWVTPGIIDIHSHDGTYVSPRTANDDEASDVSEISQPIAAGNWVEHGINVQDPGFRRALESGVTTLQILPGSVPLIGGRSVVLKNVPANYVRAMKFPGASGGVKMSCGDNPRSHFGSKGQAPNSRMGEIEQLRRAFARAREELAEEHEDAKEDGAPDPRDPMADTFAGILDGSLPVHLHCYRADDIAVMIDLAHDVGFRFAAIHHATEAYKIPELFRRNGICAAIWSDWWGFKNEAADAIRASAAFLQAEGVCVTLHSDSPALGQRLNLEAAKGMAAGRRAGVPVAPEIAIAWITSNPARALGIDKQVGTIEPGKNADVVIWSGDPFSVYSKADVVLIDGAIVFDRADARRQPMSDFEVGRTGASKR